MRGPLCGVYDSGSGLNRPMDMLAGPGCFLSSKQHTVSLTRNLLKSALKPQVSTRLQYIPREAN